MSDILLWRVLELVGAYTVVYLACWGLIDRCMYIDKRLRKRRKRLRKRRKRLARATAAKHQSSAVCDE